MRRGRAVSTSEIGCEIVTVCPVKFLAHRWPDAPVVPEGARGCVVDDYGLRGDWVACEMTDYGRRLFLREKLRAVSVLELLAEVAA